jgi:glutathione synthase/RimK-type ligase-like ATP-grasp enzyme
MNTATTFLYPYRPGSLSATGLAQLLGVKRISHTNSRFVGTARKTVINWGASSLPESVMSCGTILNSPTAVARVVDKKSFFRVIDEAPEDLRPNTPPWTENKQEAEAWFDQKEGTLVVGRETLTGHSGQGIVIFENKEELKNFKTLPLYTLYIPKREEYRVHVFGNKVIDLQKKSVRSDANAEAINWRVRSHENGFIFTRGNINSEVVSSIKQQALLAIRACGLDFGAVDVIYNFRQSKAFVIEVNTSPGLEGATVEAYADAVREHLTNAD